MGLKFYEQSPDIFLYLELKSQVSQSFRRLCKSVNSRTKKIQKIAYGLINGIVIILAKLCPLPFLWPTTIKEKRILHFSSNLVHILRKHLLESV
jgi:hypothetical protein